MVIFARASAGAASVNDDKPIPFIDLQAQRAPIADEIDDAIARVLAHGAYVMGPEVAALEAELARFAGVKHALGCGSGTDALLLALMAFDIGPGDAVFVPSFTFAATAEAVALTGATPVFTDVDADDFNMSLPSLAAAIDMIAQAGELRPRAVIPVDLFGQPADYAEITDIARTHSLKVIADCAQSFGATYRNRRAGAIGDIACTSFFPAKPLGCYGDGGAVFTDDDDIAEVLQSLRVHGQGADRYDNVRVGLNARLDTLQAAILLEKLKIFPDEIAARQRIANRYSDCLGDLAQVPQVHDDRSSVWAQYTLRLPDRDAVQTALRDNGIPTAIYYPIPLNEQIAYRDYPVSPTGTLVSNDLAREVLSLPMHPYLDEPTQDRIVATVNGQQV